MKSDLRVFAALLAGLLVLGVGYYFLVLIPQRERERLALQQQQIELQKQEKTRRAAFLAACRAEAEEKYNTYIQLNGREVPGKPGVYSAAQDVWDRAAEERKAHIDECVRLAEAGIYHLPSRTDQTTRVAESTALTNPVLAVLSSYEVAEFVGVYLRAGEGDRLDLALDLYADTVDYYDFGLVSKEFIFQDKKSYTARWPQRRYQRTSEIATLASTSSTRTIRFDYSYHVARPGKRLTGKAYVILGLEKYGNQIRITQEKGRIY